ncbi:hypothetical protein TNCV_1251381 [Trichonephila clavipes]|nr:hypothetical protein TNCV_1251381 [Trichonephila clavipes]
MNLNRHWMHYYTPETKQYGESRWFSVKYSEVDRICWKGHGQRCCERDTVLITWGKIEYSNLLDKLEAKIRKRPNLQKKKKNSPGQLTCSQECAGERNTAGFSGKSPTTILIWHPQFPLFTNLKFPRSASRPMKLRWL